MKKQRISIASQPKTENKIAHKKRQEQRIHKYRNKNVSHLPKASNQLESSKPI
jgi:hypothetical protein